MTIKKIWGSRVRADGATFIADDGLIFYDENDGELRLGDGVTPGGVAISVRADLIVAQRLTPGLDNNNAYGLGDETHRWYDAHIGDGGVYYNGFADPQTVPYIPGEQVDDIIPVLDNNINLGDTDKRFANIYLGYQGLFLADETTDANINITVDNGTLYVDGAANLAIGNLIIRDTTLQSLTTDLDINIGETDDTGFFYVRRKAQFDNTSFSSTQPMVSFNASGGAEPATIFPDTLVQAVGRPNKNSRVIQRSYGSSGNVGGDNSYAVWASYAARGSVASPAALKANDILARVSANGFGTTTWGSGGARMEFVALENFTDTAKGTRINFWTTPTGQIASQNVASINSVGVIAAGIEFSGDSTVQTTAGIPLSAKAVSSATYVATLGIDGKLDATQIPTALTGAIVFKGVWNAATNTPALSDSTPAGLSTGWEYIVEVGGTRDIGDGSKTFAAGDFVIYDGIHWKQVPSGNTFISLTGGGGITVNQSTGAIVLGSNATPLSTTATIVSRDSSGNFAANVITANLTGAVTGSVSGNAGTVTNGVYTNGSYANPSWITSLAASKVGLGSVENTALSTWAGSSNITTVGTLTSGTIGAGFTAIANARLANSSITVNGTAIALGASGTVTAAAGTLTGTALNSTVVTSSLTAVGTLTNLTVTNTITGSVSGNAGTATNGVVTTGSYANPTWITSLAGSKVTNAVLTTDTGTVTNTMLAGSIANNKLANSSITINGTTVALGDSATITAAAAAGTLTGTTLASNVVTSSLTALGGMSTIKAGEVSIDPANIGKQNTAVQTVTVSGLTTSHKVVVTAGSELPAGLFVAAAWVSATNTLSVNFHNWSGGVDASAFNLRYFAWV